MDLELDTNLDIDEDLNQQLSVAREYNYRMLSYLCFMENT